MFGVSFCHLYRIAIGGRVAHLVLLPLLLKQRMDVSQNGMNEWIFFRSAFFLAFFLSLSLTLTFWLVFQFDSRSPFTKILYQTQCRSDTWKMEIMKMDPVFPARLCSVSLFWLIRLRCEFFCDCKDAHFNVVLFAIWSGKINIYDIESCSQMKCRETKLKFKTIHNEIVSIEAKPKP